MQSRQASPFKEDFQVGPEEPITGEWRLSAARFDETYFLQDLYVSRKIFNARPTRHVDVGSSFTGSSVTLASAPLSSITRSHIDLKVSPEMKGNERVRG